MENLYNVSDRRHRRRRGDHHPGGLADGDPISSLFSVTAVLIVFGGTFTALVTQFGLKSVLTAFARFKWLVKPPSVDMHAFIEQVADLVESGAFAGRAGAGERAGERCRPVPETGAADDHRQHRPRRTCCRRSKPWPRTPRVTTSSPREVWEAAGGYLPTIGVMGAVLGLIHVMMRLDHPAELGEGIATAFVATIYGVGSANLIALPLGAAARQAGGSARA